MHNMLKKMEEIWERERFWQVATIVALIVANLLYIVLANGRTFHYDEAYSLGLSSNDFGRIIDITAQDVHSPFYYFILKLFCMLPGTNNFLGAKLLSWIFMLLFLVAGAGIICKRYGWKVTFYWVLLAGFVPSMMIQATTVRMYTMGLFFVTIASYLAFSLYEKESMKKWILFTVSCIAGVYVHTFCMLELVAVYAVFLIAAFLKKRYGLLGKVLISGIVVSLCFMPWLFVLWKQFTRWVGWETGWQSAFLPVSLESSVIYLSEWFSSMEKPQPLAVLFGVVLYIYVSYTVRDYVKEKKDNLPWLGMLLVGIILVVATLISNYLAPCFLGRYVLPLFGGVWLFGAIGIANEKSKLRQVIMATFIFLFGLSAFKEELRLENEEGLESYLYCIQEEADLTTDVIMADRYFNTMLSIYMPEASYMVYGYSPEGLPFQNTQTFKEWEQLEGVDTIWLISSAEDPGANLSKCFEVEKTIPFEYSYYKLTLEKLVRKSE